MVKNNIHYFLIISVLLIMSCRQEPAFKKPLPIIGHFDIVGNDTIYHRIPNFSLIDQDSQIVTNATFKDKIYISDFFFTSCPTICPKVKKQMLRVYDRYKDDPRVMLVSHTIDPKRDTPDVLNTYASNLDVDTDKWLFVWTDKSLIYDLADEYFVVAMEAPDVPGGFDHSGKIILVDPNRHVRGFAEGTDAASVTRFFDTIDQLLEELDQS